MFATVYYHLVSEQR